MSRRRPFVSVAEVPAESPLRAAFIGISHDHAWGKAEAIRRSPHMDLVGAFEPDAAELGAPARTRAVQRRSPLGGA